jgi:radical SAM superfamily enzyme YgiQ (UPF0313 family)
MQSRPLRERDPEVVVAAAEAILKATGWQEIGLTSLSTADYTHVGEVATELRRRRPQTVLSIPSTRVDAFTVDLVDAIAPGGRRGGFTFAPEAGSQRLRDTINKGVSDDEIARCARLAFDRGWSAVKLYFMIGLPGETMADVLAIAAISRRILQMGQRRHGGRASVKANISTFIPKVMTPFQWDGQDTREQIEAKVEALRKEMYGKGLAMSWRPRWAAGTGVSARSSCRRGARAHGSTPGTSTSTTRPGSRPSPSTTSTRPGMPSATSPSTSTCRGPTWERPSRRHFCCASESEPSPD